MTSLKNLGASLALAGLALCAGAAHAQDSTVYRGVDEKGHVVYASSPKGLRNALKVTLPQPLLSGTVAPAPTATLAKPAPGVGAPPPQESRPDAAVAQASLAQALAEQEAGKEPLPGERLGTATGGSRLSPTYFARQEDLAKAVADARSRAEKAALTAR